MTTQLDISSSRISIQHLDITHADQFVKLAAEPDIKEFFHTLDASEEELIGRLHGLNDNPVNSQYWGIFLQQSILIGFIFMQKKSYLLNTDEVIDLNNLDLLEETDKAKKMREAKDLALAPYTISLAIDKEYRRQGYGSEAIKRIIQFATSVGINQLFFEIHKRNEQSKALVESFSARFVWDIDGEYYPLSLFQMDLTPGLSRDHEAELALRSKPPGDEKRQAYDKWRKLSDNIPELLDHREILIELFLDIKSKGAKVEFDGSVDFCHFTTDLFDRTVYIGLKKRSDQVSLIWSMAHEWGHVCQEKATKEEGIPLSRAQYLREQNAWARAEKWLSDKPLFLYKWPDFIGFRNARLNTYLPPAVQLL